MGVGLVRGGSGISCPVPDPRSPIPKNMKVLHFADAHIDVANYGRHDPESGLPIRVMDFLRSLDQIVDMAISEPVDLVLFAGDAYKDRNPHPTFQREWGKRMMRLSQAGIPTVLLIGNHDMSPASGRAHTLQEFNTLAIPHIHVADEITLITPEQLGLPIQIITIPWVSRSNFMRRSQMASKSQDEVLTYIEEGLSNYVNGKIEAADPDIPLVLLAHASVQGAKYGSERQVMLGQELVLGGGLVRNKRWDYVALGHIHKHQSLNDGLQPPIVYPGSIERIDFGETRERKGFVLAQIAKGQTTWTFKRLKTRQFFDIAVTPTEADSFMAEVMAALPEQSRVIDAICRVRLNYPREWEPLVDEAAIEAHFAEALQIQIQKHREVGKRARLGDTAGVEELPPEELLALYWQTADVETEEAEALQTLAKEILASVSM